MSATVVAAEPFKFTDEEHATLRGWVEAFANYGCRAEVYAAEGAPEEINLCPPCGFDNWIISRGEDGCEAENGDTVCHPCVTLRAATLPAMLRQIIPLPVWCPDPDPISGDRFPATIYRDELGDAAKGV